MTATKEKGYILNWNWYDGSSDHIEEFKTMKKVRVRLDELSRKVKYHIIWYTITQKVEAGTYTDATFRTWHKSKHIHNIPERKI